MFVIRKKSKGIFYFRIFLIILILSLIALSLGFLFKQFYKPENKSTIKSTSQATSLAVSSNETLSIPYDDLSSKNAILIRLKDKKVLFEKNSEEIIFPASLTKIMTAVVAIENIYDLQQEILLKPEIFDKLYKANASLAGFVANEKVKALDLLYGALLPSGAECCMGLAYSISGSEEGFVELMNNKAAALGMKDTHFKNTTGLHDSDHYTTVKDLSVLLQYALNNKDFRKIFTSAKYSTSATNKHKKGITVYSSALKNFNASSLDNGKVIGGKTGYTNEAGLCLASLAVKDDKEYILITVGAFADSKKTNPNIKDALAVYNLIGNSNSINTSESQSR